MRHINLIVVHCSATNPHQDIGVNEIDQWHRDRGWRGCGYHAVIRRNGTLEHGRDITDVGAHAYGYNKHSIGVCVVGGVDINGQAANNFTREQLHTLRGYLDALSSIFKEAEIKGHRDLSPDVDGDGVIESWEWQKQCPSFDVTEWYKGENK